MWGCENTFHRELDKQEVEMVIRMVGGDWCEAATPAQSRWSERPVLVLQAQCDNCFIQFDRVLAAMF